MLRDLLFRAPFLLGLAPSVFPVRMPYLRNQICVQSSWRLALTSEQPGLMNLFSEIAWYLDGCMAERGALSNLWIYRNIVILWSNAGEVFQKSLAFCRYPVSVGMEHNLYVTLRRNVGFCGKFKTSRAPSKCRRARTI